MGTRTLRELLQQLDALQQKLSSLRPLPSEVLAKLREHESVEWTHHSTALEGNTLTLRETQIVLEGFTIGNKTLREHLEVIDHKEAIDFLESCIQKEVLTEHFIRQIHSLVLKRSSPDQAGKYRTGQVFITGSRHIPPPGIEVPARIQELVQEFNSKSFIHPIYRAAWLHWKIVWIHPFTDGNGRTARLMMNFSLMQDGYPPAIIEKEQRGKYLNALELADEGDLSEFAVLIGKAVKKNLERYISTAEK